MSAGLTVEQVNFLPEGNLETLWRRNGFTRRPPISNTAGFSNVFFVMRQNNHPDHQQCLGGPPSGEEPPPVIPGPEPPFEPGTGNTNDLIEEAANEILTRITQEAAEQGNRVAQAVVEIAGEIEAGTGQVTLTVEGVRDALSNRIEEIQESIRQDISEIPREIQAIPTATVEAVGPLIEGQTDRLSALIEGLAVPDISDLLGLVPGLAQFLRSPLEYLFTQGENIDLPSIR